MKKFLQMLMVTLCAVQVAGPTWAAPETMPEQEKRSYAIGANVGKNLKQQDLDLDPALVARGLVEAMSDTSRLADDEVAAIVKQLREEARQKQEAARQKVAQENGQRGVTFQAEYAKREGVNKLPGGILYRVLQAGSGEKPTGAEYVMCHYRGMLVDGTQFDASPPGKPATFNLDKIIAGWREALPEMTVGSKWEVVIPAEKAYGERGAPPAIGPNETLIFEVELVGFE